jgi:hypothetical protein
LPCSAIRERGDGECHESRSAAGDADGSVVRTLDLPRPFLLAASFVALVGLGAGLILHRPCDTAPATGVTDAFHGRMQIAVDSTDQEIRALLTDSQRATFGSARRERPALRQKREIISR